MPWPTRRGLGCSIFDGPSPHCRQTWAPPGGVMRNDAPRQSGFRGLIELRCDLEYFLGLVVGRERRGDAREVGNPAAVGMTVHDLKLAGWVARKRLLAFAPDGADFRVIIGTETIQPAM